MTTEADLPAIKAAVDKHDTKFDPALYTREVKDERNMNVKMVCGCQVRPPLSLLNLFSTRISRGDSKLL